MSGASLVFISALGYYITPALLGGSADMMIAQMIEKQISQFGNWGLAGALAQARGEYKKGTQEVKFPKYTRYVDDAADIARVVRCEKAGDFPPEHDLAVQETLLRACGLPVKD